MKMRILLLLLLALSWPASLFAQETQKISTFHRLLIVNDNKELMVVKIKNSDRWVTPGWYQDDHSSIKTGLEALAGTYGVSITSPVLRGVFTLKGPKENEISTRLIYVVKIKGGTLKSPDSIDEIRWVNLQQVSEIITFPHISTQIRQIMLHSGEVWGGTQIMTQENGIFGVKFVENFYPISLNNH
jgi:hypothetical protein